MVVLYSDGGRQERCSKSVALRWICPNLSEFGLHLSRQNTSVSTELSDMVHSLLFTWLSPDSRQSTRFAVQICSQKTNACHLPLYSFTVLQFDVIVTTLRGPYKSLTKSRWRTLLNARSMRAPSSLNCRYVQRAFHRKFSQMIEYTCRYQLDTCNQTYLYNKLWSPHQDTAYV